MELDREELLRTFVAEAVELLGEMEAGVMRLEWDAGDELTQMLLRGAHTLKGNASCVALDDVAAYLHRLEDILEAIAGRNVVVDAAFVTAMLEVLDILRLAVATDGELPEGAEGRLAELERLVVRTAATRAASEEGRSAATGVQERSIRVATEKLDRIVDLAGELAIARGRLAGLIADRLATLDDELVEAAGDADRLDQQLQELVMKLRMLPAGPELQRFARVVRDVALAHGKLVQLTIEGGDVEIDTAVLNALRDPLTHMIRNAIDHGIESPDARERAGKPRVGSVIIRVRHGAGTILMEVSDDGAGLDRERIEARARELGLAAEHAAQTIFHPGFSTSEEVNDLSGRGIGMDIVRRSIEALRGTIDVTSERGAGTTFTMRLPLTLALIDGFGIVAGGETYIVPLDAVVECLDLSPGFDASRVDGVLNLRGEAVPFIRLGRQLLSEPPGARESIVIVNHDHVRVGLGGDRLLGQFQTVIKPLGPMLRSVRGVAAAAILGSGDVALVLDVPELVKAATERHQRRSAA